MLYSIVTFIYLIVYSLIVSQPLFYFLAMTGVQRNMDAPSYIRLRQMIDRELEKVLRIAYYTQLALAIIVVALSAVQAGRLAIVCLLISLVTIIADLVIAVKGNIPLNQTINRWSPEIFPVHWETVRSKWLYYFSLRQCLIVTGFIALLIAVVFG